MESVARARRDDVDGPRTDYSLLARLVLATFMVLDAAEYPYRLVFEGAPVSLWGPALHRIVGLLACLALLWGWRRVLVIATLASAVFVLLRGEITGFELWWVPIAAALAVASRSPFRLMLVAVIWGAFSLWLGVNHGRGAVIGVGLLGLLGVLCGVALGLVARHRAAAAARVRAEREANARLRRQERRLLARDLREATEGLFARARRACASCPGGASAEELRAALRAVSDDARAALASLRQLLGVLRADRPAIAPHARSEQRVESGLRSARLAGAVCLVLLAVAGIIDAVPEVSAARWMLVGAFLAAALVWLTPRWGAPLALLALGATLLVDTTAWAVLVIVASLLGGLLFSRGHRSWRLGLAGAAALYVPARLVVGGDDLVNDLAAGAAGALGAALAALAVHDSVTTARRAARELETLASERGGIKQGERAALARDLHDHLGHQLSLVALQVNAVERSTDEARLRDALGRIEDTLAEAAEELEQLLAVMNAEPARDGQVSAPAPTEVAAQMRRRLIEHGHHALLDVEAEVDEVDATTRLTIARVLQEATTNVLRHSQADSEVHGKIDVVDGVVALTLRNVASTPGTGQLSNLSSGYGLRGVRERVEFSGGTFEAGPVEDQWHVAVTLPLGTT